MSALLHVEKVGKRFGGFVALQEIDLEVQEGERLGLIGPNGSGKSTLVNCICGTLANEQGSVSFAGAEDARRGLGGERMACRDGPPAADHLHGVTGGPRSGGLGGRGVQRHAPWKHAPG